MIISFLLKILPALILNISTFKIFFEYNNIDTFLRLLKLQIIVIILQSLVFYFIIRTFEFKPRLETLVYFLSNGNFLISHYFFGEYKLKDLYFYILFKIFNNYSLLVDECNICYDRRIIIRNLKNIKIKSSCSKCRINICLKCSLNLFYDRNICPICRCKLLFNSD